MEGSISHVLATVTWPELYRRRLIDLFAPASVHFVKSSDIESIEQELQRCEAAILRGVMDDRYLRAPKLKWAHCDQAGLDAFAPPRLFESGLLVSSSAGRSAPVLAEHALLFMLALTHRFSTFERARNLRLWGIPDQASMRGLNGRRICIVGLGHTGFALARLCAVLGMEIVGYRRSTRPSPLDGVHVLSQDLGQRLEDAVDGADFVALCAGLNDESHRMFGRGEMARMRPGGYLVNVARAQLVDLDALAEALRSGHLAGAGFDVFDPDEPLPPWHRAWSFPNMLITPHVTPKMEDRTGRSLDIIAENRRRFLADEPLLNQLTARDAFSHARPRRSWGIQQLMRLRHRVMGRFLE